MDKKQREARRHQEDVALTRALLWIAAAVVLEGLLVLVNRFYINYYLDEIEIVVVLQSVLKGIRIGGLVLAAGALVWAVLRARLSATPAARSWAAPSACPLTWKAQKTTTFLRTTSLPKLKPAP